MAECVNSQSVMFAITDKLKKNNNIKRPLSVNNGPAVNVLMLSQQGAVV